MKIGLMGGTFDPPHLGHLLAAEEARWRLDLERVLFIPAGQPWMKVAVPIAPAAHRRVMVGMAIAGHQAFGLSTFELERPGPSYTVDTVADFRRQMGAETELFFILGCDSLQALARWKDPERLVAMCRLVALPRADCASPDLGALEAVVPGLAGRTVVLPMPVIDISSTEVRRRVKAGQSIRYMVPEAVERYIREQGLYVKSGQ